MAASSAAPMQPAARAQSFVRRLQAGEELAHLIVLTAAAAILVITALVFYELFVQSAQSRHKFGWNFLLISTWDPVAGNFGALPFIYGTVVTSVMALLVAVPQGIGAAIFLAEMAPLRISNGLTFLIELLAAVPSVIYGLLGIFILVPVLQSYVVPPLKAAFGWLPVFQGAFYGVSYFSAGIVLSVMILPFIISVSREVLLSVPREQCEASLALGASQWETTWRVVVPYASTGIMGSIFLALARALGETMAVTMVIGNTPQIKTSLLAPGYSIAAVIANEFTEATGDLYLSALIELGLVLFGVTFLLNGLARILIVTASRKGARE
ncbi:MAG TPA: phosphate ABC transporter permease subunit PstC [Bryobacterales bacterium]|nr:phosphate ABC transporter permease subunit PstC [Bryobacterales bacterium]